MGMELSIHIRSKKDPDNFIFVGFYTQSSPMFKAFNRLVRKESVPNEEPDMPDYYLFSSEDYTRVISVLTKEKNEIKQIVDTYNKTNKELQDIIAASLAQCDDPTKINKLLQGYIDERYCLDEDVKNDIECIDQCLSFLHTLRDIVEESSIQPDGVSGIYYSIG